MAYPDSTQDPGSTVTYKTDWTAALAAMATAGITISSATVTADKSAVVSSVSNTTTSITWRLAVAAVTGPPTIVTVTITATLSNGDVDVRHRAIQVSST